jgi:hypothetical protein
VITDEFHNETAIPMSIKTANNSIVDRLLEAIRSEIKSLIINDEIEKAQVKLERPRIFSGEYSRRMWDEINEAKSKRDLREALFLVCCRLQELESVVRKIEDSVIAEKEWGKPEYDFSRGKRGRVVPKKSG